MGAETVSEWRGLCPICAQERIFDVTGPWLRDQLFCRGCGSLPRERALMLALASVAPDWRNLRIHESSPAQRGVSTKLQKECGQYVASQFFLDAPLGTARDGFRCEDLERQTFKDGTFDLVITQEVMEHVFDPAQVCREIWRTLRGGGRYLFTVGVWKQLITSEPRVERRPDGSIHHILEPEFHDDPINPAGALVTIHYGYDLPELIARWAPFDVEIRRFVDRRHAIVGEMTDVLICTKY